jgi:outer membrane biosynthesis protein TonB
MSGNNQEKSHPCFGLWSLLGHAVMVGVLLVAASLPWPQRPPVPGLAGKDGLILMGETPAPVLPGPPERADLPSLQPPSTIKNPPQHDDPVAGGPGIHDQPEEADQDSPSPVKVPPAGGKRKPVSPKPPIRAKPVDTVTERLNHARVVPVPSTSTGGSGGVRNPQPAGGHPGNGNDRGAGSATGSADVAYDQLLHGLCDRLWAEPSLSEMNNQRPTVPITVTIGSNGRILNAVISEPSGVTAMDGSVRRLCDRLRDRQLPPFAKLNIAGTVITRQIALQIQ